MEVLPLLAAAAFVAGFVDSVAGGGGLVQVPALMILLPGSAPAVIFGTNKVSSMAGTAMAVARYSRRVEIPWDSILPATVAAFLASFGGARCVSFLDPDLLEPFVVFLLGAVFVYTVAKRDFGATSHLPRHPRARPAVALAIGAGLGFYDGFFGPGTGSFLVFLFTGALGLDFLVAAASAKVVNLATNVAATAAFATTDAIRWELALPMAVCNVLGSVLGTKLALDRGARFVRAVFLVVVAGMLVKLAKDWLLGPAHD